MDDDLVVFEQGLENSADKLILAVLVGLQIVHGPLGVQGCSY